MALLVVTCRCVKLWAGEEPLFVKLDLSFPGCDMVGLRLDCRDTLRHYYCYKMVSADVMLQRVCRI